MGLEQEASVQRNIRVLGGGPGAETHWEVDRTGWQGGRQLSWGEAQGGKKANHTGRAYPWFG